jgi:hypothetical protein
MSLKRIYFLLVIPLLSLIILLPSCEDFLNPEQEIKITEDKLFNDWYEYRSVEMGLYGLQQQLVEQILVLGELRGDLLTITPNADADLVEVYNFNIPKTNKYASPTNFFKLIASCNNFIRVLQAKHPEVLDKSIAASNFDRLYGEALCMRAWAYFNAVRIYGKVPFINESLNTIEKIESFINSSGPYTDSTYIVFGPDGYNNFAYHNGILTAYTIDSSWAPEPKIITLSKNYYDLDLVIDYFSNQLEKEVKAVGVNYAFNNNDVTWEVTTWNPYAMHALLGAMYLEQGNFLKAEGHFSQIVYNPTENLRYQLDDAFSGGLFSNNWRNIFMGTDNREHIFTIWFNKANFQQNELQSFFESFSMDKYMLKPTSWAITNWETTWRNQSIDEDLVKPSESEMSDPGIPSDFARGFGSSYLYIRNGEVLPAEDYVSMLLLRAEGDNRSSKAIMDGADTIVFKYSIGKDGLEGRYAMDANFIVYRAASIHLYLAELYTYWAFEQNGLISARPNNALGFLNDGSNYSSSVTRDQMGVRGRVGLGGQNDAIKANNIIYTHDPFTNEIIGYRDLTGNFPAKQAFIEEEILNERARELAFEGERFYDLMRVAKRRNDPSFLAKKVASKYHDGKYDQIYALLMNPENWYIKYFD